MARPRRSDDAPVVEQVADPAPAVESTPQGVLDVEAWVAAVYDYRHNDGPVPVRTYLVASGEPVHVDAVGAVTAVDRASETEA